MLSIVCMLLVMNTTSTLMFGFHILFAYQRDITRQRIFKHVTSWAYKETPAI